MRKGRIYGKWMDIGCQTMDEYTILRHWIMMSYLHVQEPPGQKSKCQELEQSITYILYLEKRNLVRNLLIRKENL